MPVTLTIAVTSPLAPEDRDLLSGVAIMVLAIANHELAKEHFPDTFPDEEEIVAEEKPKKAKKAKVEAEAAPCAYLEPEEGKLICVGTLGHRGRHKFRPITDAAEAPLAN